MNEFLKPGTTEEPKEEQSVEKEEAINPEQNLDVQKAVVESLAADKIEQDEQIEKLKMQLAETEKLLGETQRQLAVVEREASNAQEMLVSVQSEASRNTNSEISKLREQLMEAQNKLVDAEKRTAEAELKATELQAKEYDQQERNPNALALLDRDIEIPDRFPGETRDHVLEVISDARDKAEAEGRLRRAQVLEAVLVANEPNGGLKKRREGLKKFFNENANVLTGPVLAELEKCGIPHKDGETYLLPDEILKRTY